jgi:hypothetical protein
LYRGATTKADKKTPACADLTPNVEGNRRAAPMFAK